MCVIPVIGSVVVAVVASGLEETHGLEVTRHRCRGSPEVLQTTDTVIPACITCVGACKNVLYCLFFGPAFRAGWVNVLVESVFIGPKGSVMAAAQSGQAGACFPR